MSKKVRLSNLRLGPLSLPGLLILLSVTTGLVDAMSVVGVGRVFVANMTGNVVFLALAVAGVPGFQLATCALAIGSFLTGSLVAGRLGRRKAGWSMRRRLMVAASVETGLLWTAAWCAKDFDIASQVPRLTLFSIIALTALAMGWRNATVRQLGVADLTTTVLTMSLTGLAADSGLAGGSNPNWKRRVGSVSAIFAGAFAGALMIVRFGVSIPLLVGGAIGFAATAACVTEPTFAGETKR